MVIESRGVCGGGDVGHISACWIYLFVMEYTPRFWQIWALFVVFSHIVAIIALLSTKVYKQTCHYKLKIAFTIIKCRKLTAKVEVCDIYELFLCDSH